MARCVEVVTQSAQLPHAILAVDEFRFCCGATEDIDRFWRHCDAGACTREFAGALRMDGSSVMQL